jgi:hypothetical protein
MARAKLARWEKRNEACDLLDQVYGWFIEASTRSI